MGLFILGTTAAGFPTVAFVLEHRASDHMIQGLYLFYNSDLFFLQTHNFPPKLLAIYTNSISETVNFARENMKKCYCINRCFVKDYLLSDLVFNKFEKVSIFSNHPVQNLVVRTEIP